MATSGSSRARSRSRAPETRISPLGGHFEPEAARPSDRLALVDRELLRQRGARREEPPAQVGARRAGARILDASRRAWERRTARGRGRLRARTRTPSTAGRCCRGPPSRRRRGVARRTASNVASGSTSCSDPVSTHNGRSRRSRSASPSMAARSARRRRRRAVLRRIGRQRPHVALRFHGDHAGLHLELHAIARFARASRTTCAVPSVG